MLISQHEVVDIILVIPNSGNLALEEICCIKSNSSLKNVFHIQLGSHLLVRPGFFYECYLKREIARINML